MDPKGRPFSPKFGDAIQNDQYIIVRRLALGTTSSVFLARNAKAKDHDEKYCAIKVLSHEASRGERALRELATLQKISQTSEELEASESEPDGVFYGLLMHVAQMRDNFFITVASGSEEKQASRHLCIVMDLYTTSAATLRKSSPSKSLPIYMTRNIVYMLLHALQSIHALGIIHNAVKLDNILFAESVQADDDSLDRYLEKCPPALDADSGIFSQDRPMPSDWTFESSAHQFELSTIYLTDFGHAEWIDNPPLAENFSSPALRAPEVILGAGIGPAIDIWAVGCMVFELTTGHSLFDPVDGGGEWSIEDDHLAKMQELTGQRFSSAVLARSSKRDQYFNAQGNLLRPPPHRPVSIEAAIKNHNPSGITEKEIGALADFIRECLNLDSSQRQTAADLVHHRFFKVVGPC